MFAKVLKFESDDGLKAQGSGCWGAAQNPEWTYLRYAVNYTIKKMKATQNMSKKYMAHKFCQSTFLLASLETAIHEMMQFL